MGDESDGAGAAKAEAPPMSEDGKILITTLLVVGALAFAVAVCVTTYQIVDARTQAGRPRAAGSCAFVPEAPR